MEREQTQARGKTGLEDWMSSSEAYALAYSGHLQDARKKSRQAADLARQAGQLETAALYETGAALREALFGNASAARQTATVALRLSKSRDVEYAVTFAQALSGDSFQSQTLTDELSKRFPEDTVVQFTYKPTLNALLALSRKEPSKAVELLQVTIPYESGTGALYPCGPQKVRSISRGDLLQPIFVVQFAKHLLNSYPTIRRQFVSGMLRAQPSCSSRFWNSRTKTGMRASAIVMHNPLPQNSPQVLFVQRDHPVQALAPHASDQSFTVGIRLWRLHGGP